MPDDSPECPPLSFPSARQRPLGFLDLRGDFFAHEFPPLPQQSRKRERIQEAYPVTDEHAILVTPSKTALVHVPQHEVLWTIDCPANAASALNLPHQLLVLGATWGQVFLWDLRTGQLLGTFEVDGMPAQLAFSTDGATLVAGLYETGVQLWNLTERSLLHTLWGPNDTDGYRSVACSPDGQWLASGNHESDEVYVWSLADGHLIHHLQEPGGRVTGLAFSPDGRLLVCGEGGGRGEEPLIRVWEMPAGQLIPGFPWHAMDPTFSPDGHLLAALGRSAAGQGRSRGGILLGEVASWREIQLLTGDTAGIMHLAFSPSGRGLLSCGADDTVRWWDITSGQEVYRLEAFRF